MLLEACRLCPLGKYEKIIVGTDTSEVSMEAVETAFRLAKFCKSFLFIVSVIRVNPEIIATALDAVERIERERYSVLERLGNRAKEENIPHKIIIHHAEQPYKVIVDLSEKEGADAIIIGTHGRSGLKRLLLGSVAARVIGYASCPTLVIPPHIKFGWERILLATDGSENSNVALEEALRAADVCKSNLGIICVVKPARPAAYEKEAERIVAEAKQKALAKDIQVETIVEKGEPWEKIVEVAKKRDTNMIIMGRYGRSGLKRLLMGSVTERVAGHAPCAVLIVPN